MKRLSRPAALLACGLLAAAFVSASADDKKATGADSPGEWTSLFDGTTLSGWEAIQLDPNKESKWEVVDGAIVGSGFPSMLFSPKGEYKNFKFRAEVKINDHGNSGMYFRTKKGESFTDGYECQINATHGDPIRTGSIYTMVHLFDSSNPPPPDEWFTSGGRGPGREVPRQGRHADPRERQRQAAVRVQRLRPDVQVGPLRVPAA